jgi:tRNA/rRNA methyltransferase
MNPLFVPDAMGESADFALLDRVRVVLVRTSHPGNIGATARAMRTMGLSRLWLVAPEAFPHPVANARAAGADPVLDHAHVVPTLAQALEGCVYSLGLSARRRSLAREFVVPDQGAVMAVARAALGDVALVFGNEASGLSNEELALCHQPVSIPVSPDFRSLNLAAAVQIMAYEIRLAAQVPLPPSSVPRPLASFDETEAFYAHLERCAIACDFHDPATPRRFMARMRRLFGRIELEKEEVHILRGLLAGFESKTK